MLPVLFRFPLLGWPMHTYGVLIVTGFLAALYVAHREAVRQGRFADDVLDFAFWALLGGMVGARVVFIAVNWREYFVERPFELVGGVPIPAVLVLWKGGLVFYGAALGGLLAYVLFTRSRGIRGIDRLWLADIIIVGLPLAHVFGRLGCISAGCCWGDAAYHLDAAGGVVADFPLTIRFPEGALAYQSLITTVDADVAARMRALHSTMPLIPIQLIESVGEAAIFFILLLVRSNKWFHGQVLLSYGLLYPVLRSINELFRGDAERGYVVPGVVSTSQFFSLAVAAASLVAIGVLRRRARVGAAIAGAGTPA